MPSQGQTINQAFEAFLAEQEQRLAPRTFAKYKDIIQLFTHSLDGYAYQSLEEDERKSWEKRWEADEEAGSFCNTFGPDKVPENIAEFLGYFMVRKVMASEDLLKAAGTVTRKLLKWLEANGYVDEDETAIAREAVNELGPELPKAERLGRILWDAAQVPPSGKMLEGRELEYAEIAKIDAGRLWFRDDFGDDETVGPVVVPEAASKIAKEGWHISALYLVRTKSGWRVVEIGNVYP